MGISNSYLASLAGASCVGGPGGGARAPTPLSGEHLTGGGVHELILEGGAACVDDQNFHEIFSPYVKLWLVSRIFP